MNMILPEQIQKIIEQKNWQLLSKQKDVWPDYEVVAPEVAYILTESYKNDRVLLFRALPRDLAAEVFVQLEGDMQDQLLFELTDTETRTILSELSSDDRTALLEELPAKVTRRLLNLLSPQDLSEARTLLGYPEESVGRLMTPDYVAVRPEWSIAKSLEHLRQFGKESETINVIYVTESSGKLVDSLPLPKFVLADPEALVSDIMDNIFVTLDAAMDREEAVRVMQDYDRIVLPVVDSKGYLLGIVTIDDVMDVAEEEATEDFQRTAAVTPLGRTYWEAGIFFLVKSRVLWLAALVAVNLLSSSVMAAFEHTLSAFVALAFFIPLLIDTGGNAGSQSATLMIRALSTGDVRPDQWLKVLGKELLVGLILGILLGVLGSFLGIFRGGFALGAVVFLSILTILFITNLFGMLLPFIFSKLKLDPAIASGPLVTSVADALGLLIYFGYANLLLFRI